MLEYGCEVWGPVLSVADKNPLSQLHRDFLRNVMRCPVAMPSIVVYLEAGQERLESRWDKLALGFVTKCARDHSRILWKCFSRTIRTSTNNWARAVTGLANSLRSASSPVLSNLQVCALVGPHRHSLIDNRENTRAKDEVRALPSLNGYYRTRSWDDISREYAWAATQRGNKSHRFMEPYLDDWNHRALCAAKMRFRAGCDTLAYRSARLYNDPVVDGFCRSCQERVPETAKHFFFHCQGYAGNRVSLQNKVATILEEYQSHQHLLFTAQDFSEASEDVKLQFLLGRRSGIFSLDRSMDRATKIYIRDAFKIRRCALASASLSDEDSDSCCNSDTTLLDSAAVSDY